MVRNLKYENQIVDQPIHDGVTLQKWIHDGVVVWEKGGSIRNIYVLHDAYSLRMFTMNPDDQHVYKFADGYVMGGCTNKYLYVFSTIGYTTYRVSDDFTTVGTEKKSSMAFGSMGLVDEDHLMSVKYGTHDLVKVALKNNQIDEIIEVGTIPIDSNFADFKAYSCMTAVALPYFLCTVRAEYNQEIGGAYFQVNEQKIFLVDSENHTTDVMQTRRSYQRGYASDETGDAATITKRMDVNGKMFVVGTYTSRQSTAFPWTSEFLLIRYDENNVYTHHRLASKTYEMATNVCTIKYANNQYYLYIKDGNTCHLHKTNEDLELLDEISLPNYIDLDVDNSSGKTYSKVRLCFTPEGAIAESGTLLVNGFSIAESVYFDENGDAKNSESIEMYISYSINEQGIYIHIDNLFFNESENNFATYVN